jgi:hypothetical protein
MISAMADGELSGDESERLRLHIEDCPSCASRLELYGVMSEAASRDEADVPDALLALVSERIAVMPTPRSGRGGAPETLSANPPRPRPVRSRRVSAPAARRRSNLRRLLPVACLIALLFAVRTNRMAENNRRELDAITGESAYSRDPDYSPGIQHDDSGAGSAAGGGGRPGADEDSAEIGAPEEAPMADAEIAPQYPSSDSALPAAPPAAAPPGDMPGATGEQSSAQTDDTVPAPDTGDAPQSGLSGSDGAGYETSSAASGYDTSGLYAVISISGELPELLAGKPVIDLGNGEYSIRITRTEADELIGQGYEAKLTGSDLPEAVVIWFAGQN